ncbi:SDR family NAD(P)-dependent oxidoreductase [Pollutimonas bauzanensis]|uniref:NAD(P)-dependent dehydrogenase, short-chain alcohol dehydrogenase family n=1 Tax=Pollutimonas bauzanensis TaxID=658167 RepID=A0A1M5TK63_9BURK|nr:SDR family NAD(P)-dependent oxidoreductase [Pollutimonas bauzanensis]SHH51094.1 NAD(P)-dependent dehydrogenase, short-chain alcohol dehydrogenase family [Pollutimonas bauzanensis]
MLLSNKVALVTGAGQGIGATLARALADAGASVIVNDINHGKADEVAHAIAAAGGRAVAQHSDISTFGGADAAVQAAIDAYGRIDILVNNAGILRDRMSYNMTESEWDQVIAVCLKGTFACARAAIREMRRIGEGGRIINIASRSGLRGSIGQANYAAAKAGVLGLTRTLCQEVSKFGITVNAISPRAVTDMTNSIPEHVRKKKDASWADTSVVRRGTPEQIAPAVVYLASGEAEWITGQVIGIGGDKLSLWSHPKEVAEAFIFGGWSVENMREMFRASVASELQSVGNKD